MGTTQILVTRGTVTLFRPISACACTMNNPKFAAWAAFPTQFIVNRLHIFEVGYLLALPKGTLQS